MGYLEQIIQIKGILMKKAVALFLLVLLLIPSVSMARNYWGALAYDKHSGRSAYSINHYTSYRARRAALRRCGHHCRVVATYVNTCIALARGRHGAYGVSRNRNLYTARRYARLQCRRYRGRRCRVIVSACNARKRYRRHRHHY